MTFLFILFKGSVTERTFWNQDSLSENLREFSFDYHIFIFFFETYNIFFSALRAMVLNSGENGYAVADIYPSGGIKITGFRKAASADIPGIA